MTMQPNSSRVAMMSGASRGIGAAICDRLAASGWQLSLGMRQPVATGDALVHPYDMAAEGAEIGWVDATVARFGRIDAIICSAGVLVAKSVVEATDAEMEEMLAVNLRAPQRLARAAWPHLAASGQGRVVIISSLSGIRVASAGSGAYAVTKHAVTALAHGLRHAGWDQGIRATAICPGYVATDMGKAAATDRVDAAQMTQPADIAHLVEVALDLPNTASVAEVAVNWQPEGRL
ncbi:SDR family NAD(P)-dependent oxidoreductase [Acidisoma cellulosilytica]|uniref:SDR family NAD(P)-dependent oxidoreductase n=1 Tax=Acidisoma cellulosilyticum TaxID=2802395 RepID=A0A963Z6S2_9PROT|nr:SDR family NAD(P)-dependent oxidoreductase [Acidisoma cellulosilyticum]MCB8883541.1 SDR family NAD(P)-dependent oxidoreductase [Acidisoma cellulosilyticum]